MEINFTLWSLQAILKEIPFNSPVLTKAIHLDFSKIPVPFYVQHTFKVSLLYRDSLLTEASCVIYSPKNVVTVVIIMKRKYEEALHLWQTKQRKDTLPACYLRRELYCHEVCHLIAIIRAFPSNRTSNAREDFIAKIGEKFTKSVTTSKNSMSILLVSEEKPGDSPSVFDKDHFRYVNDDLNYFRLYEELMLDHEMMIRVLQIICTFNKEAIYLDEVSQQTLVPIHFFKLFPEKLTALREVLIKEIHKRSLPQGEIQDEST